VRSSQLSFHTPCGCVSGAGSTTMGSPNHSTYSSRKSVTTSARRSSASARWLKTSVNGPRPGRVSSAIKNSKSDGLAKAGPGKVWGAFAKDSLAFEIDRARFAPNEPSLSEMTDKAIQLLRKRPAGQEKGFFLFVEGSEVDWGAHDNDPVAVVSELRAFDAAVKVALADAKEHGDTLVVVVADHGTGGLTIGSASAAKYSQTDDDAVIPPLLRARVSARKMRQLLGADPSEQALRRSFSSEWGIDDLESQEVARLLGAAGSGDDKAFFVAAGASFSRRVQLGWTTPNHTGADVFLFSYGPDRPTGLWQNTELGRTLAQRMGFDLESLNRRLFVDAEASFAAAGLSTSVDRTDPLNPVLVVTGGAAVARLPLSRNVLMMGGTTRELEGLVVRAEKLDKVYVPRQAVELVTAGL